MTLDLKSQCNDLLLELSNHYINKTGNHYIKFPLSPQYGPEPANLFPKRVSDEEQLSGSVLDFKQLERMLRLEGVYWL